MVVVGRSGSLYLPLSKIRVSGVSPGGRSVREVVEYSRRQETDGRRGGSISDD